MLSDITLGQYFPINSPLHRLDPRTKLLSLIAIIVAIFLSGSLVSYAVCSVFIFVVISMSKVPLKMYFKDALIKMEIALCKGKHTYDKKQSIAERDVKRSTDREIKNAGF